jgi:hypothetical protein
MAIGLIYRSGRTAQAARGSTPLESANFARTGSMNEAVAWPCYSYTDASQTTSCRYESGVRRKA